MDFYVKLPVLLYNDTFNLYIFSMIKLTKAYKYALIKIIHTGTLAGTTFKPPYYVSVYALTYDDDGLIFTTALLWIIMLSKENLLLVPRTSGVAGKTGEIYWNDTELNDILEDQSKIAFFSLISCE